MKPNADKKPKRTRKKKEPAAAVPEPGARYWRVFGQVHIAKLANADRVRSSRKAVKLVEYIETKTLDYANEISAALKAKLKNSPYIERVELWSVAEVTRLAFEEWNAPRKSTDPARSNPLTQAELFAAEVMAAMQPESNVAASPAAPEAVAAPDSQPEATTLGRGAQAQGTDQKCENLDKVSGARCGGLAIYEGKDGKRYCAVCWPDRLDEKATDPVTRSYLCGNCGESLPLEVDHYDYQDNRYSCVKGPSALSMVVPDKAPGQV